jgi:hypothetical protein
LKAAVVPLGGARGLKTGAELGLKAGAPDWVAGAVTLVVSAAGWTSFDFEPEPTDYVVP